jgi:LmbE family N-acetylglucosaminyl deacetylase
VRRNSAGRVAVLSPHLDDAVLSSWSVLRRGEAVRVVNVCTAIPEPGPPPPWDRLTGARDRAERMRERLQEDREALAAAGCEAIHLGFLDHQYRAAAPLDEQELAASIEEAAPHASELWAPAGIGGHPDHVQVRDAAIALAERGGVALRLYAELPYAAKHGWPAKLARGRTRQALAIEDWWAAFLPRGVDPSPTIQPLSRREARRKARTLALYRTQLPGLGMGAVGQLMRPGKLRYEVSFAVTTAAPAALAAPPAAAP